ncbi:MAG: YidC/Oxa1 family membrane protein insertase [Patescibacteria group bacterium]|nr:YidC/Oxa1 family membrane protein insertase [Patescibacteria group bacterium]
MKTIQITEGMWNGLMGKLLYVPLLNILVLFYVWLPVPDLGLAIIALTILIRLVLHPSYASSLKSQRDMQKVQPYIEKVKEQYKDDPQRQSQEVMKIYKEHKVNLFGSCLPMIIQLPILFALYRVFIAGLSTESLQHLYNWFPNPPLELNTIFLNFLHASALTIDLTERSLVLAILAGVVQLLQTIITARYTKTSGKKNPTSWFLYIFPLVTFGIAYTLPAALGLYWATTTLVMAIQQVIIYQTFARQERKVAAQTHHHE